MNPLIFQIIVTALSGAQDWDSQKFKDFCHDIAPLIDKENIPYYELSPIYDKYIHRLDRINNILKKIDK